MNSTEIYRYCILRSAGGVNNVFAVDSTVFPMKICDNESYSWKQFSCMPFNLSNHSASYIHTTRLQPKGLIASKIKKIANP